MLVLLLLTWSLSLAAEETAWPTLPDPIGLGPRLATIDWLKDRGVRVPAGATDAQVLQIYQQHIDGPANTLRDGTTDWDAANARDAVRRLRKNLKAEYNIDLPDAATLDDAERAWQTARDQRTAATQGAIAKLLAADASKRAAQLALPPTRLGLDEAAVELLMDPRYTGRQREANWCWAAAISMVCGYNGVTYSQEDIVRDIKGRLVDEAGTGLEMLTAMSAAALQPNGQPLQLVPAVIRSGEDVIHDLEQRQPVIALLQPPRQRIGHAVVLTGIELRSDGSARFIIRDPSPNAPSRQVIDSDMFAQLWRGGLRLRVVRF